MPTYNFDCESCGREWDDMLASHTSPNPKCECGKQARRLPSFPRIKSEAAVQHVKEAALTHSNQGGRFMLEGMHEPAILPREPDRRRKTVASLMKKFRPEMVPEYNRTVAKVEAGK